MVDGAVVGTTVAEFRPLMERVEAEFAGFGASGRNGGWASALFPTSWAKVAHESSREDAVALQRAMFETVDEVRLLYGADMDTLLGEDAIAGDNVFDYFMQCHADS